MSGYSAHVAAAPVETSAWPRWSQMDKLARRAAVIALAAEGCTASGIGAKLQTTRGAVIGFCWRQDLDLPGVSFKASVSQRREKPGVTLAGPAARAAVGSGQSAVGEDAGVACLEAEPPASVGGRALADEGTSAPLPTAHCPLPASGPIGFLALTDQRCKRPLWPDGPVPRMDAQLFCGAPSVAGSSWCRACAGRLLAGAPQPQRRAWRAQP